MVRIVSVTFAALFVACSFATPVKRTVAQIQADIATISTQVTTLDNAIKAFPNTGGSLVNALGIHTNAANLVTTITKTNTDVVNTGPLSKADAQTILSSLQAIEPTIDDSLVQIVIKKPAFQALPIGGIPALVKQDLGQLNSSTITLASSLITNTPTDLLGPANTLKNNLAAAFATAIAAYATV